MWKGNFLKHKFMLSDGYNVSGIMIHYNHVEREFFKTQVYVEDGYNVNGIMIHYI